MRKFFRRNWIVIFVITCLLSCFGIQEYAAAGYDDSLHFSDSIWENQETGYQIYLDDKAELLTPAEEEQLLETLKEITAYGHVAFVTIRQNNYYSSQQFADEYYYEHFGYESGTVFLIDMYNREIWIHSNGDIYKRVTTSYANTITDNVYTYASDGEYFHCAHKAFEQVLTLLQ